MIADALAGRASALHGLDRLQARVRQARAQDAAQLDFLWTTPDEREAELRVYYVLNDAPRVLAAELKQLDHRDPTVQEQQDYGAQFLAEMDSAGDTWEQVASYVWERAE